MIEASEQLSKTCQLIKSCMLHTQRDMREAVVEGLFKGISIVA